MLRRGEEDTRELAFRRGEWEKRLSRDGLVSSAFLPRLPVSDEVGKVKNGIELNNPIYASKMCAALFVLNNK